MNTWHRIIETSLCYLCLTLNFLALIHLYTSHAGGFWTPSFMTQPKAYFIPRTYWPSLSLLPLWLLLLSWAFFPPFFRHSLNKQFFVPSTFLSTLLKNQDTDVRVVPRVSAVLKLKKKRKVNRHVGGAVMGKNGTEAGNYLLVINSQENNDHWNHKVWMKTQQISWVWVCVS